MIVRVCQSLFISSINRNLLLCFCLSVSLWRTPGWWPYDITPLGLKGVTVTITTWFHLFYIHVCVCVWFSINTAEVCAAGLSHVWQFNSCLMSWESLSVRKQAAKSDFNTQTADQTSPQHTLNTNWYIHCFMVCQWAYSHSKHGCMKIFYIQVLHVKNDHLVFVSWS